MITLYKGAAPGTYWWHNDARLQGFAIQPRQGGRQAVIKHITEQPHPSPYVSFTTSFAIAVDYALDGPGGPASEALPGYVYEVHILQDDDVVTLIDPVSVVVQTNSLVPAHHHNGSQKLMLAVAAWELHGDLLSQPTFSLRQLPTYPQVTPELQTLIFAIRDSELLTSAIPRAYVVKRHKLWLSASGELQKREP